MKKRNLILLFTAILVVGLQSCATMISGSRQKVEIKSNVDDAVIYQNYDSIGVTNSILKVDRFKFDNMYTITKEGCYDTTFVMTQNFNLWCLTDIINPLALLVDYSIGAQYKTENELFIPLRCDSTNIDYE